MHDLYRNQRVALIIPCYNEAVAIAQVIHDFRATMPMLDIYVFDNASTDSTTDIAKKAGATVITVLRKGKGNVVRRMFADVDADIYVMVDGDATYDASSVRPMVDKLINDKLDMLVGSRVVKQDIANQAYRAGHQWGNKILTGSVSYIFGGSFKDMLSGYRVFSRRFAKSFPAVSRGFEIETELNVHALELRMPYGEYPTPYGVRPEGSSSKLATYRDGWRILKTILKLYISERPLPFFSGLWLLLTIISFGIGIPVILEFLKTGLVLRLPTALLSASIMLCAFLFGLCGLILNNVVKGRYETKRLFYLSIPLSNVKREQND